MLECSIITTVILDKKSPFAKKLSSTKCFFNSEVIRYKLYCESPEIDDEIARVPPMTLRFWRGDD